MGREMEMEKRKGHRDGERDENGEGDEDDERTWRYGVRSRWGGRWRKDMEKDGDVEGDGERIWRWEGDDEGEKGRDGKGSEMRRETETGG